MASINVMTSICRWIRIGVVTDFFRRHADWWGMPMVYAGILLMLIVYLTPLRNHNALIVPLLLMVLGVVGHVRGIKAHDRY